MIQDEKVSTYQTNLKSMIFRMEEFLRNTRRGNVLFPVRNTLFLLDLLDYFSHKSKVFEKIHIISSSSRAIFEYATANVEYLNRVLKSKVYSKPPMMPFPIEKLQKERKIFFYDNLEDFQWKNQGKTVFLSQNDLKRYQNAFFMQSDSPSIYITVDSSFRLGFTSKLMTIMPNYID